MGLKHIKNCLPISQVIFLKKTMIFICKWHELDHHHTHVILSLQNSGYQAKPHLYIS